MAPRQSRIPAEAATDKRLRGLRKDVLLVLGVHTDRNGWCVRALSKIAAELGYDVRSVRRAIRQLEDLGYLEVSERRGTSGVTLSSGYRVIAPKAGHGAGDATAGGSAGTRTTCPGEADSQESGSPGLSGVRPIALTASSNEAAAVRAGAGAPPREAAAAAAKADSGGEDDSRQRQRQMAAAVELHRRISERLGNPAGYRDELGEVLAWLEVGYDPERHVMAAVERAARRRNFQAPLMLRYFREIIAEAGAPKPAMTPAMRKAAGSTFAAASEAEQISTAPAVSEPEGPAEWLRLRARLRQAVGDEVFSSWFARLEWQGVVVSRTGVHKLRLAAPTRFMANWIRQHHGQRLDAIAAATVPGVEEVDLVVGKQRRGAP